MDNYTEGKRLFLGKDRFLARVDDETKRTQELRNHLNNVLCLAERDCPLDILKNLIRVVAILHDAGKISDDFRIIWKRCYRTKKR